MIDMIYSPYRLEPPILLAKGSMRNYNYYVLNQGTHPTAYVELPQNHPYYNVDYDNIPIDIHGGLTYCSNQLHTIADDEEGDRFFIGWDYSHYGDFTGFFLEPTLQKCKDLFTGKKYTTNEMVYDCLLVINQLIELDS